MSRVSVMAKRDVTSRGHARKRPLTQPTSPRVALLIAVARVLTAGGGICTRIGPYTDQGATRAYPARLCCSYTTPAVSTRTAGSPVVMGSPRVLIPRLFRPRRATRSTLSATQPRPGACQCQGGHVSWGHPQSPPSVPRARGPRQGGVSPHRIVPCGGSVVSGANRATAVW